MWRRAKRSKPLEAVNPMSRLWVTAWIAELWNRLRCRVTPCHLRCNSRSTLTAVCRGVPWTSLSRRLQNANLCLALPNSLWVEAVNSAPWPGQSDRLALSRRTGGVARRLARIGPSLLTFRCPLSQPHCRWCHGRTQGPIP